MQVSVNLDECLGYGNCVTDAPEVFEIEDGGMQARVLRVHPPEEMRAAVEAAALDCPARAITVSK